MTLRLATVIYLCLFVIPGAQGQTDSFLDLTKVKPPTSGKLFGGGDIVISATNDTRIPKLPLEFTLLKLDKRSYQMGDEVVYDVVIRNVGRNVVVIPWSPDRDRVKPEEKTYPAGYMDATLSLIITDKVLGEQSIYGASMYGSQHVRSSLKKLRPGQAVRIRAPSHWALTSDSASQGILSRLPQTFTVRARFSVMKHTSSPSPEPVTSNNSVTVVLKRRE
jgi:hypothetical protein